jgi:hypothetical protein
MRLEMQIQALLLLWLQQTVLAAEHPCWYQD